MKVFITLTPTPREKKSAPLRLPPPHESHLYSSFKSSAKLLTYFLAVWSTAELRLKNQWTKYIENKKTQNETSEEHARKKKKKRGLLLC